MKLRHCACVFLLGSLITVQLAGISLYFSDRQYLTTLFDRIASAKLPSSEQAKNIVRFLRDKPISTNEAYFILPIFSMLRPTARQVASWGGDCADRSRLLVRLFQLRGIRASKWVLYSGTSRPEHAVVEIEAEHGKMVVDPLFGLWFPRRPGEYYGIKDLRKNPNILRDRVQYLLLSGEQPGAARLERYPLDRYVYDNVRTINWDKSVVLRRLYEVLRSVVGRRVDEIRRPEFVEDPASMVVLGLIPLEAVIVVTWFCSFRARRRYRDCQKERSIECKEVIRIR
jgi:hypothetical protein